MPGDVRTFEEGRRWVVQRNDLKKGRDEEEEKVHKSNVPSTT